MTTYTVVIAEPGHDGAALSVEVVEADSPNAALKIALSKQSINEGWQLDACDHVVFIGCCLEGATT